MLLSQLVNEYIAKSSGVTWKSQLTINTNTSTFRVFLREMGFDPHIREVDSRLIQETIDRRWKPGNNTYFNMYTRIQAFIRWSLTRGYQLGDVKAFVASRVYVPDVEKQYLTESEMLKVREVCRAAGNHRDAALVEFAYRSGRRGGELYEMRRKDVDLTPRANAPYGVYWFTESKASKGRQMLPLLPEEAECLRIWLARYEEEILGEIPLNAYLFPTRYPVGQGSKGGTRPTRLAPMRKVSKSYGSEIFSRAYEAAGVNADKKAGHAARRGGIEDTVVKLIEAKIDDPIGIVIERTKQTRPTAEKYLNRREAARRSFAAYLQISQTRKGEETQEANTPIPDETPIEVQNDTNVIRFDQIRSRKRA